MRNHEIVIILDTPIESSYMPIQTLSTNVRAIYAGDIAEDNPRVRGHVSTLVLIPHTLRVEEDIHEKCVNWANRSLRNYALTNRSYMGAIEYY